MNLHFYVQASTGLVVMAMEWDGLLAIIEEPFPYQAAWDSLLLGDDLLTYDHVFIHSYEMMETTSMTKH